jgi:Nucleotidyl transferase AbiEii toxin, Type IV TA system
VSGDRDARELFHLLFLQWLVRATDPRLYVLKGGVNLRFFHGSPRYSEDMDLDVERDHVSVATLKKNGYKILADAAFRRVLATADIVDVRVNDPARAKHTETTQRFGVALVLASGQALPTKIELSRRGIDAGAIVERLDPEVAHRHGRTAFHVRHYDAIAAARQKIGALAGRPEPQARDLFDLYLLDSRGGIGAAFTSTTAETRRRAAQSARELDYADFEGQVVEYLEADAAAELGDATRFQAMQRTVVERLEADP